MDFTAVHRLGGPLTFSVPSSQPPHMALTTGPCTRTRLCYWS